MATATKPISLRDEAIRDPVILAALLGYQTPDHHVRWVRAHQEHQNLALLSPADHGKTTLFGFLLPLHAILVNPDIRIAYITANAPIAESVMRHMDETLKSLAFQQYFGDLKPRNPSRWTTSEITIERTKPLKDPTFFAGGLWAAIINRRFDLLVCDDLCDDSNCLTLESRAKVKRRFYEVILPCLEPDGRAVVIGTRMHYDDLYADLLKDEAASTWHVMVERAIRDNTPLWPEKWPLAALHRKRDQIGEVAFAKRFLNEINPLGLAVFPPEWVANCQDQILGLCPTRQDLPEHLKAAHIYQAVDVASSSRLGASHFAHITVAVEPGEWPRYTILDLHRSHLPYPKQRDYTIKAAAAWQPKTILVESNGVQALIVQDLASQKISLPLQPTYTGREKSSLDEGVPSLSSMVKSGSIRIPWRDPPAKRVSQQLVEEFLEWPKGRSDDLLMALWFIVKHTRWSVLPDPQPDFNAISPRRRFTRRFAPRPHHGHSRRINLS